jgi:hypothetical protein
LRTTSALVLMICIGVQPAVCQRSNKTTSTVLQNGHSLGEQQEGSNLAGIAFQSAYSLSKQISTYDRVELLLHLSKAAAKKCPEKSRTWAEEALQAAGQMPPTTDRAMYEWQALSNLATVNSKEALTLLTTLEAPAGFKDFDPRSEAATTVFNSFLKDYPGKFEEVSTAAQRIGDSGLYPFIAIQTVISRMSGKNRELAGALVEQAIHYYTVGAETSLASNQLTSLLLEHSQFVSPQVLKSVLTDVVSAISQTSNAGVAEKTDTLFVIGDDDATSVSLNAATLASIMPLLESVDPDLANKIRHEHPPVSASSIPVIMSSENRPTIMSQVILSGETNAVASDQQLESTQRTAEPTLNSAKIADKSLAAPNVEDLNRLIVKSENALKEAGSDEERLPILIQQVEVLASAGQREKLSGVLSEVFALAERLFRKSVNEESKVRWNKRTGAADLTALVEICARQIPQILMSTIRNVQTPVLRAQLYVVLAEGLQRPAEIPAFVTLN